MHVLCHILGTTRSPQLDYAYRLIQGASSDSMLGDIIIIIIIMHMYVYGYVAMF